jgi:nuclear GTP-binding protein
VCGLVVPSINRANNLLEPKSKRVPVRLRHKIEKASAAKQRKQRKLAKKDPTWRSRLKQDPGIPNLFPYKEKLLQEIEEKQRLKAEEAERRKEEAQARRRTKDIVDGHENINGVDSAEEQKDADIVENDAMEDVETSDPMAALLASAKARAVQFSHNNNTYTDEEMGDDGDDEWHGLVDDEEDAGIASADVKKDGSRKAFDKIFKQVVEAADVILYVLDARDPEGTRSKEVERMIMASEGGAKRLILILNKIDLIPLQVLNGWLKHLRRSFPTLPLRASNPAPNARIFEHNNLSVRATSEALFKALKSYAQHRNLKRSISVGIIGYPNVGKSSVINSLTSRMGHRNPSCPVGAEAGMTTSLREVKLDNKLKLIDSPGIVFPTMSAISASEGSSKAARQSDQARLILLNAIPPKNIDDPIPAVSLLLQKLSQTETLFSNLLSVYSLTPLMHDINGNMTTDFLVQVARKRGRLGKGGVPNLNAAAMTVLSDWRDGRIQGWTNAPVVQIAKNNEDTDTLKDQKEIVTEWTEEFKIEGLWGDE